MLGSVPIPRLAGQQAEYFENQHGRQPEPQKSLSRRLVAVALSSTSPAWKPTAKVSTDEEWPEPVALPEGLSSVDALDTALLPAAIAPWVNDISERMHCPPDYVGTSALTALGSVLGRKVGICPQNQTDWFVVPNLWSLVVGRPGTMKSPSVEEALKPLHRLEVKAREAFDVGLAEYDREHSEWKLRKDAAEAKFKQDIKKNPTAKLCFNAEEPTEPVERRYITNDTSYEKLGEILAQNPNGVLAYRDELVSTAKAKRALLKDLLTEAASLRKLLSKSES
jgi:putative DNA primase/helicase